MFHFADINFLYLLTIIPLLIGLFIYSNVKRYKKLAKFGNVDILKPLMPNVSNIRPQVKFYISLLIIALVIIALARPQLLKKSENAQKRGIEAMFVLDISNSMLARDVEPSRLEYAKWLLGNLIDKMTDDKIGLIVFAGDAFIQMPITADNVSAKMFLDEIKPSLIKRQGTAIGTAIDLAIKAFGDKQTKAGRAIFLITDGENHEDDAVEAAKLAEKKGIQIILIGIGNTDGSPIPIEGTMSYLKDKDGNVVVSKLDEDMCQKIASAAGGVYIHAVNSGASLKALQEQTDKIQKGPLKGASTDFEELFYIPLWFALALLLLEFFILNRKNKRLSRIKIFDRKNITNH
jgi:Ca-activated chloride channel family protein